MDGAVFAGADEDVSIWRKGNIVDRTGVRPVDSLDFMRGEIPYADGEIVPSGRKRPAVRRKRNMQYWTLVPVQRLEWPARLRLP